MRNLDETLLVITNARIAPPAENEAEIVLPHLRGGCVTVGNVVHTLFRVSAPSAAREAGRVAPSRRPVRGAVRGIRCRNGIGDRPMPAAAAKTQPQSDHDILTALNTDYINSVQHSDVKRFDEILGAGVLLQQSGRLAGRSRRVLGADRQAGRDPEPARRGCADPHYRRLRRDPRAHRLYQAGRQCGRRPLYRRLREDRRAMACGVRARDKALNAPVAVARCSPLPLAGEGRREAAGRGLVLQQPLSRLDAFASRHPLPAARGEGKTRGDNFPRKKVIPLAESALILSAPCSPRGALMRRLDGGAGRRRARRYASKSGSRRPAIPGLVLGRRPRTRFAPSYSGGVGTPPGGTTASCQELADDRWARFAPPAKARPDAGRRTPQQGAERRAGPRHGPVISGDPEIGPLARRTTGCGDPHQRLSALCSPRFFERSRRRTRGTRPLLNGPAEL